MKLYELRVAELGIMRLRNTHYFTSRTEALKVFRKKKKTAVIVDLYQATVRTDLKAADWCQLLEGDAPGPNCNLTPQNLITDRVLIATFEKDKEGA